MSACFPEQCGLKHRASAGVSRVKVEPTLLAFTSVRKLEKLAPEFSKTLARTVATYDAKDCARALRVCADIYKTLRSTSPPVNLNQPAEAAAMQYLSEVERGLGDAPIS